MGTGLNGVIDRIRLRGDGAIAVMDTLYEYNGTKLNTPIVILTNTSTLTPYETWRAQKFTQAEIDAPLVVNRTLEGADWDNDGIVNLLEYAFNLEPKTNTPSQFQFSFINNFFSLKYRMNKNAPDLKFEIQTSSNLVDWTTEAFNNAPQSIDAQTDLVTATDPLPASGTKFFRLKVIKQGGAAIVASLQPSFALPATITVTKNGLGTVTSAHIKCGSECSWTSFGVASSEILSAQPETGYQFDGWSGACSGKADCELNFSPSCLLPSATRFVSILMLQVSNDIHSFLFESTIRTQWRNRWRLQHYLQYSKIMTGVISYKYHINLPYE